MRLIFHDINHGAPRIRDKPAVYDYRLRAAPFLSKWRCGWCGKALGRESLACLNGCGIRDKNSIHSRHTSTHRRTTCQAGNS